MDVLILCGGKGTRLREVVMNKPKAMADINGKPFLDILIDYIRSFGLQRFILCTGYKSDYIEEYYGKEIKAGTIVVSKEEQELGTGGAVKNAGDFITTEDFFIFNGDSFCNVNLKKFITFHYGKKAILSMVLVKSEDDKNYGSVEMDGLNAITHFFEKSGRRGVYTNAGIYIFKKSVLQVMDSCSKFSLEYDFFPKLVNKGFYGFVINERLLDLGTPEKYQSVKRYFDK